MTVWCKREECRFCLNGICKSDVIGIDEDGECEDFESYLEQAAWQKPFWKRMIDKENNIICRVLYHGLEFEIKGRKFFVDHKGEYANATDAITGLAAGNKMYLEERIDKINEVAADVKPPLEELPIAIYDEKTRKFIYENEAEKQ